MPAWVTGWKRRGLPGFQRARRGFGELWREAPVWLRVLTAVVVLWLLAMLPFEETRWNAVAELWGVAGAGVVVW